MKITQWVNVGLLFSMSVLSVACFGVTLDDDQELKQVVAAGKKINQSASQSQQKIDDISEQIQSKLQQFKVVNKETEGLAVYNEQMQAQLDDQMTELAQLATSMEQVSVIERQVSPLMARMIDTLATFIQLDVPFLPEEREKRVNDLKTMLTQADVSVAEKFRRVLEAYQIEVDYGRTIEVYSGMQQVAGVERDVDFLRVGRVSFVYQSRDGKQMGVWDQSSKSWQYLPAENRSSINKAMRIARKQLAPDLIIVPVAQNSAE